MRQSPTNEKSAVTEVKVVDVEKRRAKDSSGKNYVRRKLSLRAFFLFFEVRLLFHRMLFTTLKIKKKFEVVFFLFQFLFRNMN